MDEQRVISTVKHDDDDRYACMAFLNDQQIEKSMSTIFQILAKKFIQFLSKPFPHKGLY